MVKNATVHSWIIRKATVLRCQAALVGGWRLSSVSSGAQRLLDWKGNISSCLRPMCLGLMLTPHQSELSELIADLCWCLTVTWDIASVFFSTAIKPFCPGISLKIVVELQTEHFVFQTIFFYYRKWQSVMMEHSPYVELLSIKGFLVQKWDVCLLCFTILIGFLVQAFILIHTPIRFAHTYAFALNFACVM